MNTLEKYLSNEPLDLTNPTTQRDLYLNISEGLQSSGGESSLAISGVEKYLSEENKEPEYPEMAPGTPPKNLANEIRNQEIIPSEESLKNYEGLFKKELPGTGDKSESEIKAYEQTLAHEASNFERGFPLDSQEKLGISILGGESKEIQETKSQSLQDCIWGPSKAFTGIFKQDKDLYMEGMQECMQIGKFAETFQDQMAKNYKKGLENLLGKENISKIEEGMTAFAPLEKALKDTSKLLLNPNQNLDKKEKEKVLESLYDAVSDKDGKLHKLMEGSSNIIAMHPVMQFAFKLPNAVLQKGNDTSEEKKSDHPKKEEPGFFEKFAGLLSSRVAYDKAMKKGASPKQAGELSEVAMEETKEHTKGLDKSLEKNGGAVAKGAQAIATHALSKAALAVPPPIGVALSIGVQVASSIANLVFDKDQSSQGAESPEKPANAIPGSLSEAANLAGGTAGGIGAAIKKVTKTTIAKGYQNGLASVGDTIGTSVANNAKETEQYGKKNLDDTKALDRM